MALAAGLSQTHNKTPEEIRNNATKLGTIIHAKVTNHMCNIDTEWKATWVVDDNTTESKEAGPIPQNLDQFVQALGRYKRWVCGRVLEAAAKQLRIVIVIFEPRNGRWTRIAVINEGGGKHIIPLLLRNDHFTTLIRPKKGGFPREWGVVNGQDKDWKGRAAGPSSLNSWLNPASLAGSSTDQLRTKSSRASQSTAKRTRLSPMLRVQNPKKKHGSKGTKSVSSWIKPAPSVSCRQATQSSVSRSEASKQPFRPMSHAGFKSQRMFLRKRSTNGFAQFVKPVSPVKLREG